ncbi:MAG: polyphosphate kinase 1 [Cyanobacteria bacterium P01_H01_bin.121]
MPSKTAPAATPTVDLTHPDYYFNRELSWLEFNRRVLHESLDERTPLLERLKFLAIFGSNLDEFFMVRVAGVKRQVEAGVAKRTADGLTPEEQLQAIRERLLPMVLEQHHHFEQVLRPLLTQHGIYLLDYPDLSEAQQSYLQQYFDEQIFPVLTPLAVDPGHPFPFISNQSLNLAVMVRNKELDTQHFARVKVPLPNLPRFVKFPKQLNVPSRVADSDASASTPATGATASPVKTIWTGIPIEQVIAHNLEALFPGRDIQECFPFRVTRNADLSLEEEDADDLMLAIEQEVRKRVRGGVVCLEVPQTVSANVLSNLIEGLEIHSEDVYAVEGTLGLVDLFSLMSIPLPKLKDESWSPVIPPLFQAINNLTGEDEVEDIMAQIRRRDILLHHPYHSFAATVQRFIEQAAYDPQVLAIKMTLYRTSGNSPIVQALIAAAENKKQVAVLVELKARFDEENNIQWAKKLERAGVHVVYGLVGLKTHTKTTLVVRREEGKIRRYVHIGTGNYNPKTAKLYTDLSLLSCRDYLGADLTDLFNYLTGYSGQQAYRKLLIAPVNMRQRMLELIRREVEHVEAGRSGKIIAKMNALVDPTMIQALYQASQAGVEIDLIIRGICCLRPGLPGLSERIRVISIIGRFLEHPRIFYFHNHGQADILIGSADWMPRNLDRRVEAVVPMDDPAIAAELRELLNIDLADNRQAWELQPDGSYVQRQPPTPDKVVSSQLACMERAAQLLKAG